MTDNFMAVNQSHKMTKSELTQLTINAIEASFISEELKDKYRIEVTNYLENYRANI